MKNPWLIVGGLALVLIVGAVWYAGVVAERNNAGISFTPHRKGNAEAQVTLVEYSDFQCPACAAFQPVLNEVLATYGDRISLEYRHFPLPGHRHAHTAARAAEAAGQQGKFFEYHDILFASQSEWAASANPTAIFYRYAEELGLEMDQFRRHFNASLVRDRVAESFAEGRTQGVTGTPTFFLNGERMEIETYEDFINRISRAIDPASVPQGGTTEGNIPVQNSGVRFGI